MSGRPRGGGGGALASPARRRGAGAGALVPGSSSSGGSGGSRGSSSKQPAAPPELQVIQNPHHFSHNAGVAYFLRIYMTIVAGAAAGIAGMTGWAGFAVYLISQGLCTLPILAKCGGSNYKRFLNTWDKVYVEHVFSSTAILSYILLWMVFYNICHVF